MSEYGYVPRRVDRVENGILGSKWNVASAVIRAHS